MNKFDRFLIPVAILLGIIGLILVLTPKANTAPLNVAETCQYPDRTTNPPGGCDNTNPCDPLDAAKGGSGECKPEPVAEIPVTPKKPIKSTAIEVGK